MTIEFNRRLWVGIVGNRGGRNYCVYGKVLEELVGWLICGDDMDGDVSFAN
jgi:hypothetical protein